jgi:hypothetical protein
MKGWVRRYVHGDLTESLRHVTPDDFERVASAMRNETITLKAGDIVKVLQSYLKGQVGMSDLIDWTTIVFYGVHPQMVQRRDWGTAGDLRLLQKGIADPTGIKKLHVRYDEKCGDTISEVMNELEDLGDVRTDVGRQEVEGWIEQLLGCGSEHDSGTT